MYQPKPEATVSVYGPSHFSFYREKLLALRPTPKLEDHPLSAFLKCLFNLFSSTLFTEGRLLIRNLRMRQTVNLFFLHIYDIGKKRVWK